MSLSIGIVGLPNVGKSTLFNALTKTQNAQAANYPFCTIEPNKATVAVPDARLAVLHNLVKPQKVIHASVDFIDIAGLVRGASKGEGLGNQFLANIRECAAIVHVVRCFEDDNITHVNGQVNPLRDIDTIETELLLADIQSVEKRLDRLHKTAKFDKDAKITAEQVAHLREHLNEGSPALSFACPDTDAFQTAWREMGLITAQKIIYCANVDEDGALSGNIHADTVRALATERGAGFAMVCAKIEEELQGLPKEEQSEMQACFGIEESGLVRIIRSGYGTLGLISYFTAGEKEVRAWTIYQGWKALQAAGVIHSDFEKGFIRVEIIAYKDYITYKSEAACRTAGVLRTEGKDYVMHDGDVAHFLFNV